MRIPAICPSCNGVFPGPIEARNVETMVLRNNIVEPCPYCGGTARLLEGRFTVVGDVLQVLDESELTRQQLQAIAARMLHLREHGASRDEVVESLRTVDGGDRLVRLLPDDPLEVVAYLTVLLEIIRIVLGLHTSDPPDVTVQLDPSVVIERVEEVEARYQPPDVGGIR